MITREQIRKSQSSATIMFKAAQSNQLSENCAIFNPAPGIEFNFSIIAKAPIKGNSTLDICKFVENHPKKEDLMMHLGKAVFDQDFIDKFGAAESGTTYQRVFTLETIAGERATIISYLITATYERF